VAQKKAYSRYFIILQQDENGYSLASDKLPSGYAKLETKNDKCKISYYVQNLKKEMEPYYMMLICNKKDVKKIIKLGMMNIDDYGRAEITYEYNVDNVAGSNIPVDMVTGAAVIKFVDTNIVSVMSGFSTTDVPGDWRGYSVFEVAKETVSTSMERNTDNNAAKVVAEHTEGKKEVKEKNKEEKNIFDEYEQKIEEVKSKSSVDKETEQKEKARKGNETEASSKQQADGTLPVGEVKIEEDSAEERNKESDVQEEDSKTDALEEQARGKKENDMFADNKHKADKCEDNKHKDIKHEDNCPNGTVGDFFKALASDFEEVKETCREIKRCRWYKVPVNSLEELCNQTNYNKYTIVYYPMISYYSYLGKYGHYLLGYKYDAAGKMKYLVYGVPGKKSRVEQPYGGKSGFVTWVPLKPGEERDEDMGYWLMFYDFRTSTIVIPMK
jgi:hypothetical protein